MNISKRLQKLETLAGSHDADIIRLIEAGAFYDELSEDQKDAYCDYWNIDRATHEEVEIEFCNGLHFQLRKRPFFRSPEEEREHIKQTAIEIETYLNQVKT